MKNKLWIHPKKSSKKKHPRNFPNPLPSLELFHPVHHNGTSHGIEMVSGNEPKSWLDVCMIWVTNGDDVWIYGHGRHGDIMGIEYGYSRY